MNLFGNILVKLLREEIEEPKSVSMIDMEQQIRNLYAKTIHSGRTTEKIDRDMQEEILTLLKGEEKKLGDVNYEKLRDTAFLIASAAEENGVVQGFRYAFRLFWECIQE